MGWCSKGTKGRKAFRTTFWAKPQGFCSLFTAVTKAPIASLRVVKMFHGLPVKTLISCDNQLGDTIPGRYIKWLMAMIDEDDANVPAIVRINGPRTVQHRHPMFVG
jgi:hypothetical protein